MGRRQLSRGRPQKRTRTHDGPWFFSSKARWVPIGSRPAEKQEAARRDGDAKSSELVCVAHSPPANYMAPWREEANPTPSNQSPLRSRVRSRGEPEGDPQPWEGSTRSGLPALLDGPGEMLPQQDSVASGQGGPCRSLQGLETDHDSGGHQVNPVRHGLAAGRVRLKLEEEEPVPKDWLCPATVALAASSQQRRTHRQEPAAPGSPEMKYFHMLVPRNTGVDHLHLQREREGGRGRRGSWPEEVGNNKTEQEWMFLVESGIETFIMKALIPGSISSRAHCALRQSQNSTHTHQFCAAWPLLQAMSSSTPAAPEEVPAPAPSNSGRVL